MKTMLYGALLTALSFLGLYAYEKTGKRYSDWKKAAVDVITHYEGFFADVYNDPIGIPTIGYGHVVKTGDPTHVTEAQARAWLIEEIEDEYAPAAFAALASRGVDVEGLSAMQKGALVSFAYNLGPGAITTASWPGKWKSGDRDAAAVSWKAHCRAGGNPLPGLVRRRFTEWLMFSEGTFTTDPAGWRAYYENLS